VLLCSDKIESSRLQVSSSTSLRIKLRNPAADDVLCIVSHQEQPPDQNIPGTNINSRVATAGAREPDRSGIHVFGLEVSKPQADIQIEARTPNIAAGRYKHHQSTAAKTKDERTAARSYSRLILHIYISASSIRAKLVYTCQKSDL
jgi:hypothetical protein